MYRLELICKHTPHECRCKHTKAVEVNADDLTANLIKHNPALLKYLGKRSQNQVNSQQAQQKELYLSQGHQNEPQELYQSIVQEKGLKFIVRDNPQKIGSIAKPQSPRSPINNPPPENTRQSLNQLQPPPAERAAAARKESDQQKRVKKYHKDLRNQSRYLSNSGFRKYFDRQCFENYGHKNISHKADGFVYHNYLKTHNINPHTGQNMPLNQQTFFHALVSASPEKYAAQQQLKLAKTLSQGKMETLKPQREEKPLEKEKVQLEKVLEENLKHSKLEEKYKHVKIKQKESSMRPNHQAACQLAKEAINPIRSQANLNINSKQTLQAPKNLAVQVENRIPKQKKTMTESISGIRKDRGQNSEQRQAKECNHSQNMYESCEYCHNQMKKLIVTLSESDPDLAARLLSSAKKAAIYKNYTLNNYDNAALNPRNFRSDGTLNIFQE